MKIGLITDSINTKKTGIGIYSEYVISHILKKKLNNEFYFIDFERKNFHKNKLILIKNPFSFIKTHLWHNLLPKKISKENLDMVLNFTSSPHYFSYKQKEVFFLYDVSWKPFPQYHPFSRVLLFNLLFKRTLKNSYKIVADSNHAKNDIIKYFNVPESKISVIYPPLPKLEKKYKQPSFNLDMPYILFVGTIKPTKNIESLLKAFYKLKRDNNFEHKLILCGKREKGYTSDLKLVNELNLENDVIYTNYVENSVKAYLYKNADVFVSPSFYEGFGLPALESMFYGCPVITSDTSSIPEVVGNAAIMVKPDDIQELTKSINKVIVDKKLRLEYIKLGYKRYEFFQKNITLDSVLVKLFQ